MKRLILTVIIATVALAGLASYAGAFTMNEKVVVANELIAVARVPAGGYSAQERIDIVNERLAVILGFEPLAPRYIYAVPTADGSRAIMVGDRLLITVTPRDAEANNTTVQDLTRTWIARAESAIPQARPNANLTG